ncbi:hypothetical protein [Lonsdalea quercina]
MTTYEQHVLKELRQKEAEQAKALSLTQERIREIVNRHNLNKPKGGSS